MVLRLTYVLSLTLILGTLACSEGAPSLEVAPSSELQERLNLYAENRPTIKIEVGEVPPNLRDLIPFAEQWGIGDDIIRHDVFLQSTPEEKEAFRTALKGRTGEISVWLDSFPPSELMPDAAAHFMYMLSALDENGLWPD